MIKIKRRKTPNLQRSESTPDLLTRRPQTRRITPPRMAHLLRKTPANTPLVIKKINLEPRAMLRQIKTLMIPDRMRSLRKITQTGSRMARVTPPMRIRLVLTATNRKQITATMILRPPRPSISKKSVSLRSIRRPRKRLRLQRGPYSAL